MSCSDDETYTIPLRDQRVFGAGLKRKRVQFVPASSSPTGATAPGTGNGQSVAEKYLSIVLKNDPQRSSSAPPCSEESATIICEACKLPTEVACNGLPHEATLAHQVSLKHSHPPSAIDRNRKGLSYLQAYGWDPDSRRGLGSTGEGMLHPIKVKEKRDTVGLGVKLKPLKPGESLLQKKQAGKLNAGQVRKKELEVRRKHERLQRMFYQSEEVERYLGALE